jgi:hypothetical protein
VPAIDVKLVSLNAYKKLVAVHIVEPACNLKVPAGPATTPLPTLQKMPPGWATGLLARRTGSTATGSDPGDGCRGLDLPLFK